MDPKKIDPRVLFTPEANPRDTLDALTQLVRGVIGYEVDPRAITMMVHEGPGEHDLDIQIVIRQAALVSFDDGKAQEQTWFRLFQIEIVGKTEEDVEPRLVELLPPYRIIVPQRTLRLIDEATTPLPTGFPKEVM